MKLDKGHYRYALRSQYAAGDIGKAFELLVLIRDSVEGIIKSYNPKIKLPGAQNRENVTCYLDALLFGMFVRLDCFEVILYNSFRDEPRRNLSCLLRLWVNMLRSGKLINQDIVSIENINILSGSKGFLRPGALIYIIHRQNNCRMHLLPVVGKKQR